MGGCAILHRMGISAATHPVSTVDPMELLQDEYERYVNLIELARITADLSPAPSTPPAPAPLTINSHR